MVKHRGTMADERTPFHNPFAALGHLRGTLPDEPAPPAEPAPAPGALPRASVARAVVRIERTGRGGKEVTVIEHLGLPAPELQQWLKALKATLGCGGAVDGDAMVLQGDHRDRLVGLLAARGVRKVVRG